MVLVCSVISYTAMSVLCMMGEVIRAFGVFETRQGNHQTMVEQCTRGTECSQ